MPKHKLTVFISLICLAFFSFFIPASSPARESAIEEALTTPVRAQISAYGSNQRSQRGLFTTDFIIPLYYPQSKDTLLFFNPKYTYTTPEADEVNQGLGLRHIFNDSFILGINAFFDRRLSHSEKWYSQAGLGLEYLSHPLDIRFNWYKPLTRYKVLSEQGGTGSGTYQFTNNSLIELGGASQEIEEPLQGFDFEVGFPLLDQYTKTRLYLGGFFYQSRLSKDVNGFRARSETSLTHWLSLDTVFNTMPSGHDEFYGGARVILPFEWTNLFKKNTRPLTPLNTYLEERMFDRVVRDIDIQAKTSTRGGGSSTTKVHDLVYVDDTAAPGGNGTLTHPFTTIQDGINAAFGDKWVYVEGRGLTNYAGDIALTNSVTLWGSGYNGGFRGLTVSGIYPVIDGGTNGLTLANNNTVIGMQIQHATNSGIIFTNGTTLTGTIKYNTLTGNSHDGIDLDNNSGTISNFIISNNIITSNGHDGIDLDASGGGTSNSGIMDTFTISSNTINSNGNDGINLSGNQGTISTFTIFNNTTSSNGRFGIDLSNNSGTISTFTISNNTSNSNGYGIALFGNSGTISNFTISNNTTNSNGNAGIDLSINSGTISGFKFSHNTVTLNGQDGIAFANSGGNMNSINLGDGTTIDTGHNSIYDNNTSVGNYYDIENSSGIDLLPAQYNWWGRPDPQAIQFTPAPPTNTVDYTHPLSSNPN